MKMHEFAGLSALAAALFALSAAADIVAWTNVMQTGATEMQCMRGQGHRPRRRIRALRVTELWSFRSLDGFLSG